MSPVPASPGLPPVGPGSAAALAAEAQRYLEAVDAFRAEGRAIEWRPERGLRRRPKQRAAAR